MRCSSSSRVVSVGLTPVELRCWQGPCFAWWDRACGASGQGGGAARGASLRGVAVGWLVLLSPRAAACSRCLASAWRLLPPLRVGPRDGCGGLVAGNARSSSRTGLSSPLAGALLSRSLAAVVRGSRTVVRFLAAATLAFGVWCWRHGLAVLRWLTHAVRVSVIVYVRAGAGSSTGWSARPGTVPGGWLRFPRHWQRLWVQCGGPSSPCLLASSSPLGGWRMPLGAASKL